MEYFKSIVTQATQDRAYAAGDEHAQALTAYKATMPPGYEIECFQTTQFVNNNTIWTTSILYCCEEKKEKE